MSQKKNLLWHFDWPFIVTLALVLVLIFSGVFWMNQTRGTYVRAFGSPEQQLQATMGAASAAKLEAAKLAEHRRDAQAAWGQYGDYVGGELNPFLAFMSFCALALALVLQTKQVQLSRTELQEARADRLAAQIDAKAQLKAARTLAAAQLRTARGQERAAQYMAAQLQAARDLAVAQERAATAMERAAGAQEQSAVDTGKQVAQATEAAAAQLRVAAAQEQATTLQQQQVAHSWIAARLTALSAQLAQQFELLRSHEAMGINTHQVKERIGELLADLDSATGAQEMAPLYAFFMESYRKPGNAAGPGG